MKRNSIQSGLALYLFTKFYSNLAPHNYFTDNMLYIIGGRNNTSSGNIDTASVERYDPLRDEWRPVKSLSVPRNRLGVAVCEGCIYAIGGGNGNSCHVSVECYNPKQDEWTTLMPLNFPRIGKWIL